AYRQWAETPDAESCYQRGLFYLEHEDYRQAMASFTSAIYRQPTHAEAYRRRGDLTSRDGRYQRSIGQYTRAIKLRPDFPAAYPAADGADFERGIAYTDREEYDAARADFNKALQLQPTLALTYRERADTWDPFDPRVIAECDRAIELAPNDIEAYARRAQFYA